MKRSKPDTEDIITTSLKMPDEYDDKNIELRLPTWNTLKKVWTVDIPTPKHIDKTTLKNILFLATSSQAVAHYRTWIPAVYTSKYGFANCRVCRGGFREEDLDWADILVVNRLEDSDNLMYVHSWQQEFGKTIVYDTDDNIHKVPRTNPAKIRILQDTGPNYKKYVEAFIRMADVVTVSTQELATFYRNFNDNINIVGNYLDFRNPAWSSTDKLHGEDEVYIGFAGSDSHTPDLFEIADILNRVVCSYDNVYLALCGRPEWMKRFTIPKERMKFMKWVGILEYPLIMKEFDISLAPLVPTDFNNYKTALKVLDAGAMGVPTIASAMAPYTRFDIESREATGKQSVVLCKKINEWEGALRNLIEDKLKRKSIGESVKQFVYSTYNAAENKDVWWNAYKTGVK